MPKLIVTTAVLQLGALGLRAQLPYFNAFYHIDTGTPQLELNASDGIEPLDNWFGNEFTAAAGHNLLTSVDFLSYTATNLSGSVAIYTVGNPRIGATLAYSQAFSPAAGDGNHLFDNHIDLNTPVTLDVGEQFIVAILLRNVDGGTLFPYVIDNGTSSANSFWDRSAPGAFNLADVSGAMRLDYPLAPGGYVPGGPNGGGPGISTGVIMLRADGIAVPEPTTFALSGLGAVALLIFRRRKA